MSTTDTPEYIIVTDGPLINLRGYIKRKTTYDDNRYECVIYDENNNQKKKVLDSSQFLKIKTKK